MVGAVEHQGRQGGGTRFFRAAPRQPASTTLPTTRPASFFGGQHQLRQVHDHPHVTELEAGSLLRQARNRSFLNRTQGGKVVTTVTEKSSRRTVQFVTRKGERKTAKLMFLSGKVIGQPAPKPDNRRLSRREQVVITSPGREAVFQRALVQSTVGVLHGRGLVHPSPDALGQSAVDSRSCSNGSATTSRDRRAYERCDRLVCRSCRDECLPADEPENRRGQSLPNTFARAGLRPLTPYEYAMSLVLVTGDGSYEQADSRDAPT